MFPEIRNIFQHKPLRLVRSRKLNGLCSWGPVRDRGERREARGPRCAAQPRPSACQPGTASGSATSASPARFVSAGSQRFLAGLWKGYPPVQCPGVTADLSLQRDEKDIKPKRVYFRSEILRSRASQSLETVSPVGKCNGY